MHSVVTRTGDGGHTNLYGKGGVSKDTERIQAYGTVDELNALLGVVLAEKLSPAIRSQLEQTQHMLFRVGADLSTPIGIPATKRVRQQDIDAIEDWIFSIERDLPPLNMFILPDGIRAASLLHLARTVCRRAERRVVTLTRKESMNRYVQIYLNRLSDFLFCAARATNLHAKRRETSV